MTCRHEGGLLKFCHSILVSIKLRFSSSTSSKNSNNIHRSLKILKAERKFGILITPLSPTSLSLDSSCFPVISSNAEVCSYILRYCHNNVCWKLHWHYMCQVVALSVLLMVSSGGPKSPLYVMVWII